MKRSFRIKPIQTEYEDESKELQYKTEAIYEEEPFEPIGSHSLKKLSRDK